MTGYLYMWGYWVTGLPTDIQGSESDASNWAQVSKSISDAMTNTDTVPRAQLHMANKRYVDALSFVIKTYADKQDVLLMNTNVF